MTFTIAVIVFAAVLLLAMWRASKKSRRLSLPTWHELAGRLQPVQTEGIRTLASDFLEPATAKLARSPEEIWDLVGGVEGLKRMKENADVLIALASYAQVWNHDESVIVTERMRRDGLMLRRAVLGLGFAILCGYGRPRLVAYIHEAASSYYLMRERLLELYKSSHAGIYPALADTV